MIEIKKVTVAGKSYNVPQAPATEQKRLMLLLGSRIALSAASKGKAEVDQNTLVGTLTTLSESDFDQVTSIVMEKVILSGGTKPVTIDDFQGAIGAYFQLVAAAIAANLDDFFTWLGSERSDPATNQ